MDTTGAGGGVGVGGGGVLCGGKQPSRTWRRLSLKQYKRAPTQDTAEVSVLLGFVLFIYLLFFFRFARHQIDPFPLAICFSLTHESWYARMRAHLPPWPRNNFIISVEVPRMSRAQNIYIYRIYMYLYIRYIPVVNSTT